jgi:flagellar motor switch protein FliN/FliY
MDLQLQVSVELGKVKKPIKDILQFTQGTIVELDRLAGENVDVLVSGKIIAKGEVVVVDQNGNITFNVEDGEITVKTQK